MEDEQERPTGDDTGFDNTNGLVEGLVGDADEPGHGYDTPTGEADEDGTPLLDATNLIDDALGRDDDPDDGRD